MPRIFFLFLWPYLDSYINLVAFATQQNSLTKGKHWHIVDNGHILRCWMLMNEPSKSWGNVVLTIGYLINWMSFFVLNNWIPHSILYPEDPFLQRSSISPPVLTSVILFMPSVSSWVIGDENLWRSHQHRTLM